MKLKLIILFLILLFGINIAYSQSNVSGGFNLTYTYFNNSNYEKTIFDLSADDFDLPDSSNISENTTTYSFNINTSNYPYQTQLHIFNMKNGVSEKECSSTLSSSSSKICEINYDDNFIKNQQILGYYICNEFGKCGILQEETNFYQKEVGEQIRGGFGIEYSFSNNSNSNYEKTIFDISGNDFNLPESSNISENTTTYSFEINVSNYPYQTQVHIFNMNNGVSEKECSSTLSSSSSKSCEINYDDNFIKNQQNLGYYICNEFGRCGVPYGNNKFYLLDVGEQIRGGFRISYTSIFNISSQTNTNITYISPTPKNNLRKSQMNNFTVKVDDPNGIVDTCELVVNGTSTSMSYDGSICEGTYNIESNKPDSYTFYVNYTENGEENQLSQRTIYNYPENSSQNLPAYGLSSLIITLLILMFSFFQPKRRIKFSKKAISGVVATSLLLVIGVSSAVTFQTFYKDYQSGLLAKIETQGPNTLSQLSVDLVKESTTNDEIYINNPSKNFKIISELKIGDNKCNLPNSDVIANQTTTIIDVNNCGIKKDESVEVLVVFKDSVFESNNIVR